MPQNKKPKETPGALQAYLDYEAMGAERSLDKLVQAYRTQSATGHPVPTTRVETVHKWSSEQGWQERVKAREEQEAELVRAETRKRVAAYRRRIMSAIEADGSLYAQWVAKGEAVLAEDAASLERMTKLYFQLAEEPLAEKVQQEHTGANGGPLQVETMTGDMSDEQLAQLAANIGAALIGGGGPAAPDTEGED